VGAQYHLKITYREKGFPIAVQNQPVPIGAGKTINEIITTRFNYRLAVAYQLVNAKNDVITSGNEDALASYNVTASSAGTYATETANLDAQKRAADDIANRLKLDLALYFAHHPGAAK
jgi:LPS-assembly lipoprotein